MIVQRLRAELPVARYLGLTAIAVTMRVAVSDGHPASSQFAALIFAAMLAAIALAATVRRERSGTTMASRFRDAEAKIAMARSIGAGIAGAAVLVFFPYRALGVATLGIRPTGALLTWSVLVSAVAIAEEVLFRGVLFRAILLRHGAYAAVLLCAVAFAFVHVPMYGWHALPIDTAVGIWLGAVRLWGGVRASAISHTLADLATGWLVI